VWDGGEASTTQNTNWKPAQPEHSLFREGKGNLKFTIVMCYPDNHPRSYKPHYGYQFTFCDIVNN